MARNRLIIRQPTSGPMLSWFCSDRVDLIVPPSNWAARLIVNVRHPVTESMQKRLQRYVTHLPTWVRLEWSRRRSTGAF
jgi:hypothetical protein